MRAVVLLSILLAGCASAPPIPPRPAPVTPHYSVLPTGSSMVGTSTFATVLDAPPDLAAIAAQRAERKALRMRYIWYGKEQGLSPKEGAKAQAE